MLTAAALVEGSHSDQSEVVEDELAGSHSPQLEALVVVVLNNIISFCLLSNRLVVVMERQ